MKDKIRKIINNITQISIIKTLRFNLHYFKLIDAVKMPIHLSK